MLNTEFDPLRTRQRCKHAFVAATLALLLIPATAAAAQMEMTDTNVRDAVEDRFYFDQAVPFDQVDATVNDGVVRLTGSANNILAKRRATRLAETVRGVRSVVNNIQVKPATDRPNAEIENDIESAWLLDPATESLELTVDVTGDGSAELTGTVESWQEKRLAEKVAAGVKGVTAVSNEITVAYATQRPDAEIAPEVKAALEWDALIDAALIDVTVDDGRVTLGGTVGSAAEKRRARYNAWVAGVNAVDTSDLKVRGWARDKVERSPTRLDRSESAIRAAVNDANLYDPRVDSFQIDVDVTGSVATLRGTVDNLKAKWAAANNARNTVGVSRVVNRLKVRPADMPSDETVESNVRSALLRDPFVERHEIAVNVIDGTAMLTGTVNDFFTKAQAEDAASRVPGVTKVENNLVAVDTATPVTYDPYVYDWNVYDYTWYDWDPATIAMTDQELKEEIDSEMWWSPFVDSDDVQVSVDDGVATLSGTVEDWSEYRSATENAIEGGAVAVDNDLLVTMR